MVFKWFDFLLLVFPVTKNSTSAKNRTNVRKKSSVYTEHRNWQIPMLRKLAYARFRNRKKTKSRRTDTQGKKMGDIESANGLKAKYKNCKNCGCSFRLGKGVNSKGKRFTPVGIIIGICTLGIQFRYPIFSLQKYCSRECWRADTQN